MSLSAQHPASTQQPALTTATTKKPAEEEITFADHLKIAGTILLVALGVVVVTVIVFWMAL